MAKLTESQKEFIIAELAMFSTPTQVALAFKDEFGIEISRQQVNDYKPTCRNTKKTGKKIGKKLAAIHEATRAAFLEKVNEIPVANKSYRLKRLQRLLEKAEMMGSMTLAASLLEQAAKDVGDVFTNRHKVENTEVPHEAWLKSLPR